WGEHARRVRPIWLCTARRAHQQAITTLHPGSPGMRAIRRRKMTPQERGVLSASFSAYVHFWRNAAASALILATSGAECLRERRGDDDISECVAFEAGERTSPADIREQWGSREQRWEEGQELFRVDDGEGEINSALRLAELPLEDGFSLE